MGVALKLAAALDCMVEDLFALKGDLGWVDAQLKALEVEREALLRQRERIIHDGSEDEGLG